jgi:predicted metal-dependent phosphoesterase TrpH
LGRPTPKQAIECIHLSGGIASIAHPGRLTLSFSEREKTIYRLKELGVDGIEAYYTTHTNEETAYFSSLAKELSLLKTGGSDTHFEGNGGNDLYQRRIGTPSFAPSQELLERLKIIK